MKHWPYYAFLPAVLMLSATAVKASQLDPPCIAASLQTYQSLSSTDPGGCSVGIQNFVSFTFTASEGAAYNAADIEVTPAVGGFEFSLVSGSPFEELSGSTIYDIGYTFYIDPGPSAGTASLGMDPPFGDVTISQYYCADSEIFQSSVAVIPTCSAGSAQILTVNDTNPPTSWTTGVVPLVPPVMDYAQVVTMIDLVGLAGFDGVTGDSFVTDSNNSTTPEPSTVVLAAMGGLLITTLRKRFC